MLLVDNLDDDETHAASNAHAHQYEHARHVLQAQSVGRLLEEFAVLLNMPMKDPLFIQFFHKATCEEMGLVLRFPFSVDLQPTLMELEYGQRDSICPRRTLLQSNAIATTTE